MKGVVRYNKDGLAICEICKKPCKSVGSHSARVHKVSSEEYRKRFGLNRRQPLCSPYLSHVKSVAVLSDPPLIKRNLLSKGAWSRFKAGNIIRKKIKLRKQGKLNRKKKADAASD